MGFSSWLGKRRRSGSSTRCHRSARTASGYRPRLEALEDRLVPAQIGLTVTSLADSGAGTLRAAIQTADAGTSSDKFTIGFAVSGTIDLQSPLPDLNSSIAIQGPGASSLTIEPAGGVSLSSAIVTVDSGQSASLSGLTIANGNAGGIFNDGTLTVSACAVSGNRAFEGGGIASGGTLTVSGCTVSGNSASDRGGGIIVDGGRLTVSGSTIANNSGYAGGGGILVVASYPSTITNSRISGNTAISGGGIGNLDGNVTISGTMLSGNSATGIVISTPSGAFPFPGYGGGIYNDATLTLSGCTLAGNTATGVVVGGVDYASFGGGITNSGSMTVRDSLVSSNCADLGGGIWNAPGASLDVRGSTFSGNTASDSGGAIYNLGTATVQECTLSGNTAGSGGGGIFNGASGTLTIDDSTVCDNAAALGADLYNLGVATINDSDVCVIGP